MNSSCFGAALLGDAAFGQAQVTAHSLRVFLAWGAKTPEISVNFQIYLIIFTISFKDDFVC